MMVDLTSFSDEKFDAKKWINAACQARHPQEPVEKHLVDVEMKLQMLSEEIAASLEEQSASALLRVPRATRDVLRLREDALSLRHSVAGILQKLKKVTSTLYLQVLMFVALCYFLKFVKMCSSLDELFKYLHYIGLECMHLRVRLHVDLVTELR